MISIITVAVMFFILATVIACGHWPNETPLDEAICDVWGFLREECYL